MALPASGVHSIRPPRLESDFANLVEQAARSKCVFRVWDANSTTQLVWTSFSGNSGFCAPDENLGLLSSSAYMKIFKDFRGSVDWTEGAYMKQTVVDHVLETHRHTALNYPGMVLVEPDFHGIPFDERSPWISTTKSLFWAIWKIASLLAKASAPRPDVDPDNPNGLDPAMKESAVKAAPSHAVNLTIIRHHSGSIGLNDARRNHLELHIDPKGPTGRVNREMSVSLQGDFAKARWLAGASEEILYYGRIFTENIDSNLEFTTDKLPLDLPPALFDSPSTGPRPWSPGSDSSQDVKGWLRYLCWDPLHDDFDIAMDKIDHRRRRLGLPSGWAYMSKTMGALSADSVHYAPSTDARAQPTARAGTTTASSRRR